MSDSTQATQKGDYLFFKYRTINKRLIESLVDSCLYFAKPQNLNDPFDCRLDLGKSFRRAAALASGKRKAWLESALTDGEKFIKEWVGLFDNFGICSFSLDLRLSLMWSHYADEHRGACLLYRFSESFFLAPENIIFGTDIVKYREDVLTDWLLNDAPLELKSFVAELAKLYLTAKSPAWEYEREARVIRQSDGVMHVPTGCLEQVCFGLRTSEDDKRLVTKLASEYTGCKKFAQMVRDETDFGIVGKEF